MVPAPRSETFVSSVVWVSLFAWLLAFMVAAGSALLMLRTGIFLSVVDRPNERSLHTRITPRVGGIPLLLGAFVGCGLLACVPHLIELTLALLGGVGVLACVGATDDRVGLSAGARLVWQIAASAGAVVLLGHATTQGPIAGLPPVLLDLVLVLTITWSSNLYNFMDGSDGLAGSMGALGFGALASVAVWRDAPDLAVIASAFAGSSLGFLMFNWHPARIFLGDVGSVPLGFAASVVGIAGASRGAWSLWTPLFAFWPFAFDATWTLARRLLRGARIWEAHREHLYQKLVRMGWGHKTTALVESCVMAACASLAAATAAVPWQLGALAAALLLLMSLGVAILVEARWASFEANAGPGDGG